MAFLQIIYGPAQGRCSEISLGAIVIGRHASCEFVLPGDVISRRHARLRTDGGSWIIEDLDSQNGTYVNGARLREPTALEDGDEIRIGDTMLRFTHGAPGTLPPLVVAPAARVTELPVDMSSTTSRATSLAEAKLRGVLQLSAVLGRYLPLRELLPELPHGVLAIFPQAACAGVLLREAEGLALRACWAPDAVTEAPRLMNLEFAARTLASRMATLGCLPREENLAAPRGAEGTPRWLSIMSAPLCDAQGDPMGVVQAVSTNGDHFFTREDLDVFASLSSVASLALGKASLHDELNLRQERLRALLDNAPLCIHEIDLQGRLATLNAAGLRMMGATDESQVVGHPYLKCVVEEDRTLVAELLERAYQGDSSQFEFRGDMRGTIRTLRASLIPLWCGQGTVVKVLGYAQDITHHRQAELAVQRVAQELLRSNKELQDFANTVSHDLQAPLRGIRGFAELLQEKYASQLDADGQEYLGYIMQSARHMQALITALLDYSRVQTQGKPPRPTDANQAVRQAIANLRLAIEEAQAVVTVAPLPIVLADATQLVQLFQNLIDNGLKFCRQRPPRISITAVRQEGECVFCVQDNGIGVPPEFRERIFGVFKRLHLPDEFPGVGIGLAIARRVVERHGGRLWVEAAAPRGSAFRFTLPSAPLQAVPPTDDGSLREPAATGDFPASSWEERAP